MTRPAPRDSAEIERAEAEAIRLRVAARVQGFNVRAAALTARIVSGATDTLAQQVASVLRGQPT